MGRCFVSIAIAVLLAIPAEARITRIQITKTEPAFGGVSFGTVGPYERLTGKAFGEVDPKAPGNALIQDIQHEDVAAELLDGDGLGEVAGLVNVAAAADGDVVGQQLQRNDLDQRREQFERGRNVDDVLDQASRSSCRLRWRWR